VFSFFPFINLSSQNWQSVTAYFNHPSLKPYLSYILPIMYSPSVDGKSLYPSQRNDIYAELVNQQGYYTLLPNQAQIRQVSIVRKDHGVERLRLLYPASDNQSARLAHYAEHYQQYFDLLTESTDTVKLQGHHLNLTISVVNDFIAVDYFYPEQPLLREKDRVN
jgi:hypothetical protein